MISGQFGYATPATLEEAIDLLKSTEGAAVVAGGVSLIKAMRARRSRPSMLVDLRKIPSLAEVRVDYTSWNLIVGATATYASLLADPAVCKGWPALAEALAATSDPQVRNRATVGGSLADADPAADLPAAAMALGATVQVFGPNGSRQIGAEELIAGPHQTLLRTGEVITSVTFPAPWARAGSAYEKFKNPASGFAICGVAALVELKGVRVDRCRVAVTGASVRPARLRAVEDTLLGKDPRKGDIVEAACRLSADAVEFVSDLAASSEYRAHLTRVLTARAIGEAARRAISDE